MLLFEKKSKTIMAVPTSFTIPNDEESINIRSKNNHTSERKTTYLFKILKH